MNILTILSNEIKNYIIRYEIQIPEEAKKFLENENLFGFQKILSNLYNREIKRKDLDEKDKKDLKKYLLLITISKQFLNILNLLTKKKIEKYYSKKYKLENSENKKCFIYNKNKNDHNEKIQLKIKEIIEHINQPSNNESYYFVKLDLQHIIPNEEILFENEDLENYFVKTNMKKFIYEDTKTQNFEFQYEYFNSKENFIGAINNTCKEIINYSEYEKTIMPITIIFYVKGINFNKGTPKNIFQIGKNPYVSNNNELFKFKKTA